MQYIHSAREFLSPLLKVSNFKETGLLTTREFEETGDFLISKFPSWSWASGKNSKIREYLPVSKQYLVTRNVPCLYRIKTLDIVNEEEKEDDSWTLTRINNFSNNINNAIDINDCLIPESTDFHSLKTDDIDSDSRVLFSKTDDTDKSSTGSKGEFILDIEDDLAEIRNDNIIRTRTYDISITYDKYYQTPRIWLTGYDEYRNFLSTSEIFEDISPEHANKTVTIETHPHESLLTVSIHPCQHANVMKILINGSPNKESIKTEHYILIFLKFINTILPSMNYEYTSII